MIKLKRAYDEPQPQDGYRVLVDRVWPRGIKKRDAAINRWMKRVAPSTELRKWFRHEPDKWDEFLERYHRELDEKPEQIDLLKEIADGQTLTLVFAATDRERNNAMALKRYLENHGTH